MFTIGLLRWFSYMIPATYILQWLITLILVIKRYLINGEDLKLTEDDIANLHWCFIVAILIELCIILILYGFVGLIYYFILNS